MTPQSHSTRTPDSVEAQVRTARIDVRTRQLRQAAAELMQKTGSHGVSMRSIAENAGVSVGLIYRYYNDKEELVRDVIVGVLDEMTEAMPRVIEGIEDPVRQVAAAFRAYAGVVANNRKEVLLTYRESNQLDPDSLELIKEKEMATGQPLRIATENAIEAGLFRPLKARIFAYNLMVIAHMWALKYWYYSSRMSFDEFVDSQFAIALSGAIHADYREQYSDLLEAM